MSGNRNSIWNKDTTYFALCFAIGAVVLIVFRWPGIFDRSALITAVVLCSIIMLYATAIWVLGLYRLRRDEGAADNLYFLGFIFTVSALGVSLYRYYVAEAGTIPIEQIMGDLGIGISTTVLGLFLRVLFLNRDDPADLEDSVRRELVDIADSTISSIMQTADILDRGVSVVQQTVSEIHLSMKKLDDGIKKQTESVTTNLEILGNRVQDFEISPDAFGSKLEPAIGAAISSLMEFSNKVDQIAIPADTLSKQFDSIIQETGNATHAHLENVTSELARGIDQYFNSVQQRSFEVIGKIEGNLISHIQNFPIPEEKLQEFHTGVISSFENHSKELGNATRQVIDTMDSMVNSMSDTDTQLKNIPGTLSETFFAIQNGVTEIVEKASTHFEGITENISALEMEQAVSSMKEIENLSKTNSEAVLTYHKSNILLSERLSELTVQLRALQETVHLTSTAGKATRPNKWPWLLRRG